MASGGYTPPMSPRVLLVDNAVHRFLFKPTWHWKAYLREVSVSVVNVPSGRALPAIEGFSHIILTGSEASILERKPWFSTEVELIRRAVELGIPILGSCFGHQMLVYALSGPEWVRASNPPEVGWAEIEMLGSDELFQDLPNPWRTFVYHFDEAFDPPAPWVRLGRTAHCTTHVLRYGRSPVWGIQAHPEISTRKAKLFIQVSGILGRKPLQHVLHTLRHAPPPVPVADRLVDRFLTWEPGVVSGHPPTPAESGGCDAERIPP
jgi:GMP synthase-like glutamine amidotransferase